MAGGVASRRAAYSSADYCAVARLHVSGIHQGFLPTLGERFLALLYEAMDADSHSVLLVERSSSGEVLGFVCGGRGMGAIYRQMLRRWPRLMAALLPAILNPRKVIRMAEILWFSLQQKPVAGCPKAELFSIAVADTARGTGVAQRLYAGLMDHFVRHGEVSFCIVVGPALVPAHRFYCKMGAVPIAHIQVHQGQHSTVYRHDLQAILS